MVVVGFLTMLLLALHLIATGAYHLGLGERWLASFETLSIVPKWHFFAPRPGTRDLVLLHRNVHSNGTVGVWRTVAGMDTFRSPWSFAWNPDKRRRKTLYDAIVTLSVTPGAKKEERRLLQLSLPYVLILNYVASLAPIEGATGVQFAIMESAVDQRPRLVLASELHAL